MRRSALRAARCLLALALGGLLVLATTVTYGDRPDEPAGDVQDLLFFGGGPPILVRLHLQVGGMPLSAAYREGIAKLHAYLDANGDGTLTREEADRVEWPRLVRFLAGNPGRPNPAMTKNAPAPAPLPALDFRPQDGVVSVDELGEFLRGVRTPFSVQTRQASESDQDTTFARIDANGDETLSTEERAQAAAQLRKFDLNDDEALSAPELATFRNPIFGMGMVAQPAGAPPAPVVLLDPAGSRIRMVQQLLNRLDTGGLEGSKTKDHRLSRTEIGLGAEAFKEFDNDGDETLDSDELMQFLDRGEPAVEMVVRLGPKPLKHYVVEFIDRQLTDRGKPGLGASMKPHDLEVVDRPAPAVKDSDPPRVRVKRGDDVVTLDLGDVLVDLRTEDRTGEANQTRAIVNSQFDNLDADKSGTISLAEVKGQEPFQSLFRLIDRNADGQLAKAEIQAALALLESLSQRQVLLGISDRGVLLFGNLDTNGDGHLGLRELRAASDRLATFDRNGDGQVSGPEIPHRFEWFLSLAPLSVGVNFRTPRRMMNDAPARAPKEGPLWFQKMDRNHDGDLSPREFLGPLTEFRRLDADGDGLIGAVEVK